LALKEKDMTQAYPGAAPVRQDAVITPLIVDLLEWLAAEPRDYAEVMDGWRTSCPRLTVWEDAVDQGLVRRLFVPGGGAVVEVTADGRRLLTDKGRLRRSA
jgi:hypothetical protein